MLQVIQRCCCKIDCHRVIYNPSGRGRVIAPECAARLQKRSPHLETCIVPPVQPEPGREPSTRPAVPAVRPSLSPERVAGPPPLPTDGPGQWAAIPAHPGYTINSLTGEVRTAWRPTSVNGNPTYKPLGPWKPLTPFTRGGKERVRIRDGKAGGSRVVAELVMEAFGASAPYFQTVKGVA